MTVSGNSVDNTDPPSVQIDGKRVQGFGIKIHLWISYRMWTLPRPPHKVAFRRTQALFGRELVTALQARVHAERARCPGQGLGLNRGVCRSAARSRLIQCRRYVVGADQPLLPTPSVPTRAVVALS